MSLEVPCHLTQKVHTWKGTKQSRYEAAFSKSSYCTEILDLMHASLVCRLDVLETWENCLQGTQKVPIHDMRLWPCMAQFRMDLWECRADGRVIECPTQKASAWDLNQHQSLSLRLKDRNMCFPTESACMPHQLKRTWSSVHCTVIHVAVAVSLVPSCIYFKYCLLA